MHSARAQLVASVVAAMLFGSLIDGLIFALAGSNTPAAVSRDFPPSWFVGTVWIALFGLMGAAFWWVRRSQGARPWQSWSIVALLLFCAAYPFYTGLFHSQRAILVGNFASIAATVLVMAVCWPVARRATALLAPTFVWLVFATVVTLQAGA